jgi:hypothetical protein
MSYPLLAHFRERDHSHVRPESTTRHAAGTTAAGHQHTSSDSAVPKSEKKSRDRDRSSRESRPEPLQFSSVPAADSVLKSPAPSVAAESSEPKSRSDRDRDRKKSNGSSSSKQRQEPKKTDDSEAIDAVVEDGQVPLTETEAQLPKRIRRPVAASELAALNVDPKALESLGSDHGENEDDETPKMMLRLRKRHDKDEKKDDHGEMNKGIAAAAAPSTPDAHNREDGDTRTKVDLLAHVAFVVRRPFDLRYASGFQPPAI